MTRMYQVLLVAGVASAAALAQSQSSYAGSNVTGKLVLVRSVNLLQLAQPAQMRIMGDAAPKRKETLPKTDFKRRTAPVLQRFSLSAPAGIRADAALQRIAVAPTVGGFGFDGITHAQQRLANGGNQYSVEPPNPSIAVANGYVLQGVNNAIQVYDAAGNPKLPVTLASNQLFGVSPAIIWSTGNNGVFPTDMRVFYDHGINRWFVLQRAQDYDIDGNPLPSSRLYLAVSQTANPIGTYNIYTMDTTNPGNNWLCPCVADYPQVGADQYGFYISANEYPAYGTRMVDATILAISKASLASGAVAPTVHLFVIPWGGSGYDFTIHPATTPPGASYFLGIGGVEYFLSSQTGYSWDSNLAVWAMTNTSSLLTQNPSPVLIRTLLPTMTYSFPDVATQRPGVLPYGSTLMPPGRLAFLDGNDTRILSLVYAGAQLYTTFAAEVTDETGRRLVGGIYVIISPTVRNGLLQTRVLRQGYLAVKGNHILRPAIAVNPQGRGAVVFTLVGPDYYPSAAYLPIDTFSTGTAIQIARPGAFPQDGFSGYDYPFVARWGDYSSAVAGDDGSIWMTTEYIPNLPRTELANWGTFIIRYRP